MFDAEYSEWKAQLRLQKSVSSSHLLHEYVTSGRRKTINPTVRGEGPVEGTGLREGETNKHLQESDLEALPEIDSYIIDIQWRKR